MYISKTAHFLLELAALVATHGYVSSIEVDGKTYGGYLVDTYYYESDPPELMPWSTNSTDDYYVAPTAYNTLISSSLSPYEARWLGQASQSGTLGESLYKDTDLGTYVNIWQTVSTYTILGPALHTAGSVSTATSTVASTTATTATAATAATVTSVPKTSTAEISATEASASSKTTAVFTPHAQANGAAPGNVQAPNGQIDQGQSSKPARSTAATSTSSTSPAASGVLSESCSQEDSCHCNGGTAFQRCVNGEWDASQSVASGTKCDSGVSEYPIILVLKKHSESIHLRRQAIHSHA
ncbi:endoglucanase-4 precursor [Penicillium atrosanguineum]|uniref:Endoglucanase-4 n=1 Tax=Penicillium atrosanguineum TaxID=1132637 RepID=A0A9W9PY98_9EURO|nr:endoglucanase-4 precursor [Penicillium atrosanguineum]KAJ5140406.1 endoglucanase-4 precursor [Penicillium atrosanguineum]KAJ5315838.1 endoglucanase-4 precursor [Penicillium atrosanguineum]